MEKVEVQFEISDVHNSDQKRKGKVAISSDGVFVSLDGLGLHDMMPGFSDVVCVEVADGVPRVCIWDDITDENCKVISLEGADEDLREGDAGCDSCGTYDRAEGSNLCVHCSQDVKVMARKVNGVEITAKEFVWDGCHKIYLINSDDDRKKAEEMGYSPLIPIEQLQDVYESSCGLRFINNWSLTTVVGQFEEDVVFEGFKQEHDASGIPESTLNELEVH